MFYSLILWFQGELRPVVWVPLFRLLLTALLLISGSRSARAMDVIEVTSEYSVVNYTEEDGVPSGDIYEVAQDPAGYLWMATQFGLVRYDGIRFQVWTPANLPEATDRSFHQLSIASDGSVWVATGREFLGLKNNRVSVIRPSDYSVVLAAADLLAYPGGLWMGGNHCLAHFRGKDVVGYYGEFDGLEHHQVTSIWRDADGMILVGSALGLRRFVPETNRFTRELGAWSFNVEMVDAILVDKRGNLWIVPSIHPQGVHAQHIMMAPPGGSWQTFDAPDASNGGRRHGRFLVEDHDGYIWAAAGPGGMYRSDGKKVVRIQLPESFAEEFPLGACADREGNLWIGTEARGLLRLRRKQFRHFEQQRGLASTETESMHQSADGNVWLGSSNGLFRWDGESLDRVEVDGGLGIRDVRAIVEDDSDVLWIGAREGLFRLTQGRLHSAMNFGPFDPPKIRALQPAADGALWIGTVHGAFRWANDTLDHWNQDGGLPDPSVRTLLQDRAGRIWAGTDAGLAVFNGVSWTGFTIADGLSSNFILDLHEDQGGRLWIATGGGLSVWDGELMQQLEGRLEFELTQIVEDDQDRIWVTSDRGVDGVSTTALFEAIINAGELPSFWHFGREDGLDSLQFAGEYSQSAGIRLHDGTLLFATDHGVFEGAAEEMVNPVPPSLPVIRAIRAGGNLDYSDAPVRGQTLPIDDLSAPWSFAPGTAHVLEFELNAPAFAAPDRVNFRYRLSGLKDNWSELDANRRVYFADLEPGVYRFEVQTVDKSGRRSEQSAAFGFVIEPFLHQTAWFYAGVSLVGLGLAGGFHLWRVRYFRRIDELERGNMLLQERTRIGHDLHDGLGSLLTRIHFSASMLKERRHSPETIDGQLNALADSATEAGRTLREMIWLSNPKPMRFADVVGHLRHYAQEFLADSGLSLRLDTEEPPEVEVSGEIRQHALFAIKEILQNCVRHAQATQVSFGGRTQPPFYRIEIADNGLGFDPERSAQNRAASDRFGSGTGFVSLYDRLHRIGGRVEIRGRSDGGGGTAVTLWIPLARSA